MWLKGRKISEENKLLRAAFADAPGISESLLLFGGAFFIHTAVMALMMSMMICFWIGLWSAYVKIRKVHKNDSVLILAAVLDLVPVFIFTLESFLLLIVDSSSTFFSLIIEISSNFSHNT